MFHFETFEISPHDSVRALLVIVFLDVDIVTVRYVTVCNIERIHCPQAQITARKLCYIPDIN